MADIQQIQGYWIKDASARAMIADVSSRVPTGSYVQTTGDTMTGNLTMSGGQVIGNLKGNASTASDSSLLEGHASSYFATASHNHAGVYATASHTHSEIATAGDTRTVSTIPTDYNSRIKFPGLKNNSAINAPSTDTYSYVVGLRGWSDNSGGVAHEYAFNNSGVFHRVNNSTTTTTWDAWEQVITSDNWANHIGTNASRVNYAKDSDKLNGQSASYYATASHNHDSSYLKLTGGTLSGDLTTSGTFYGKLTGNVTGNATTASNSSLLEGHASSYFATASHTHSYLPLTGGTLSGGLTVTGTVSATGGFVETSDINKKNVVGDIDLDKAYELIDKCSTIIYTLKDDPEQKEQVGMIAQEIQEFYPELIEINEDGSLMLSYSRLTVIIIKVMKDLIERIKKLETK